MAEESTFECSAISIQEYQLCIVSIYRAPNSDLLTFLNKLLYLFMHISRTFKYYVITGDLNINALNANSNDKKQLFDLLNSFQADSVVNEPTRIGKNNNKFCSSNIDYIITNFKSNYSYRTVESGFSDHLGIVFAWNQNFNKNNSDIQTIKLRKFNNEGIHEFRTRFNKSKLILNPYRNTIDEIFGEFMADFSWNFEVAFPEKLILISKNSRQNIKFSRDLVLEIDKLKSLNWFRKQLDNVNIANQYKTLKKNLKIKIENEKRQYIARKIENSENKAKTLWQFANKKLGKLSNNNQKIVLKNNDGTLVYDPGQVANMFGEYFANSISRKVSTMNFPGNDCTTEVTQLDKSMFFYPLLNDEVINIIKNLKNNYSTGLDGVPIKLLKECACEIAPYLTLLVNKSVLLGKFPSLLKEAKVIPVYKKNDQYNMENYRSVCVLSCFSKVMEKAVYERIISYLNKNQLITKAQHGFRQKLSTETACTELVQFINDEIDDNKFCVVISFDLSRAFETLAPKFLSKKLDALGIRGTINNWLISYVTDRKLKVKMENTYSGSFDLSLGTPQGGVLGPLLFLLYVNDLPNHIREGRSFMYADDTTIVVSSKNRNELFQKINSTITSFNEWCNRNHLIINMNKTVCVQFVMKHRSTKDFKINFNDIELSAQSTLNFLGIKLDFNLTFNEQIDEISKNLSKTFFLFTILKQNFNQEQLIHFYYALVYSHLSSNILVWGQAAEVNRLFLLQKRFIRLIFNLSYTESCRSTFKNKNILTLYGIYLYKILIYIHINKKSIDKRADKHQYPTRNKTDLHLNSFNYMQYKKSPYYAGSCYYNFLPESIKCKENIIGFKKSLKDFLLKTPLYTINEYFAIVED